MTGVRDAATVVIVRDSPDLHVLMLQRNPAMQFGGGAHVFPGGAVGDDDRSVAVGRYVDGFDDATASNRLGLEGGGLGFWVAAVREAFEEAGILLLRDALLEDLEPFPSGPAAELRHRLNRKEIEAHDFLTRAGGRLLTDSLPVFAHFVTPPGPPRRYDTWFFVTNAPPGQAGAHDDHEAVQSEWVQPRDMLRRAEDGSADLFGPTPQVLRLLARYERATDLVEAVGAAQHARGDGPSVAREGWGERVVLPGEHGFGSSRSWTHPLVAPRQPAEYDASDPDDSRQDVA